MDYIIIGAGPTGLTLAYYLGKLGKKVLLIEKENTIGGTHRVKRVNGFFTEHGPRIYINNYLMFMDMLNDMGTSFYDIFTEYNFGVVPIVKKTVGYFSFREMVILFITFITLNDSYRKKTMLEYTSENNFSKRAKWYIDRLCRLTDGAGIKRYTLHEFIQTINQNGLYGIYQPKLPNDIGLFKIWEKNLKKYNVNILLNTEVSKFNIKNNNITNIVVNNKTILCKNVILACPPGSFIKILPDAFGNIDTYVEKVKYLQYIPIVYHWDKVIKLKKIWGFPSNGWGLASIILSDYMKFTSTNGRSKSGTVISVTITIHDKSSYIGKRPNECSKHELIEETFRQLKEIYPNLPVPDHSFLENNTYINNKWELNSGSFMLTKHGFIDYFSKYRNLYNCGVQNGKSYYDFNSLEAAVQNAINLLHIMEPKMILPIRHLWTLRQVIALLVFLIITIIYLVKSRTLVSRR